MASTVLIASISLALVYCSLQLRALRQNIAKAKQSGLPYVIAPVYFQSTWWLVFGPRVADLLHKLPKAWSEQWLSLSLFNHVWRVGYEPFALLDTDTVIIVSSGGNVLWTCDPEANVQFSRRHHDFVKPVEMLDMLNMYGPNITATEGEESRRYRKIAGPAFNDRTHGFVWTESRGQAAALLNRWSGNAPIMNLKEDLAKLTLHVISFVCFDRHMHWGEDSGEKTPSNQSHKMGYSEAISSAMASIPIFFLVPSLIIKVLPLAPLQKARAAYNEWKAYMEEMRESTKESLQKGGPRNNASLLECFVEAGQPLNSKPPSITPEAVLGNFFVFIMGGHETSANTLSYAIALLACRPALQRAMQSDIDNIFGSRDSDQWSFGSDFPKLLQGYVGAVMNETLRHYAVIPFLPKTTRSVPKPLTLNGREYTVPADTLILMNTSATHRNPKYWPSTVPKAADGPPYPVSSFDPAQWLRTNSNDSGDTTQFSPTPGSYIPFADGPRACIGKHFAQVQFCGVMASIFKYYTVELATDTDEAAAGGVTSETATSNAERALSDGVDFMMALKMTGKIPLRLLRRNQEQKAS